MAKGSLAACVFVVLLAALVAAAPAQAQTPTGQCGGIATSIAAASLTPDQGQAGSNVTVAGVVTAPILGASGESTAGPGGTVALSWENSPVSTLVVDSNLNFSGPLTVPGNAPAGVHVVELQRQGDPDPFCLNFTVLSAQQDAYAVTRTSMPSTGYVLIMMLGGLFLGGLGATFMRIRSHGND